ncbi:lantibiotic dehydratase [Saccharopolyspora rosea]|uniref:Lantibiotic dehydratase n=1 Tax=Saccharopolyspora rosea TaxID=524884 RepID=A0ABW3FYB2_9PSEU
MDEPNLFRCADIVMLRAPVFPVERAADTAADIPDGPGELAASTRYLARLAEDALMREAVAVSSPALARRWDEILAGRCTRAADVRRAVRALSAYRVRMATRSTPFGLMAGVAVGEFAERDADAKVSFGGDHRRVAGAQRDWVLGLVDEWQRRPDVRRRLRLVVNDLCSVRGGRVVLPHVPARSGADPVREVSLRRTGPVRLVLEAARTPIRGADLEALLAERFPDAAAEAIDRVLDQLIGEDVLLTELRPPDDADPAEHVLGVLDGFGDVLVEEREQLRGVVAELRRYEARPGRAAWDAVTARAAELRAAEHPAHVDLVLDADLRLPPAVQREAEKAADLLWHLSPEPASTELDHYHAEFVERYGVGRPVPVLELLDPDAGLGAPAGYRRPPSHRRPAPTDATETDRDRVLLHRAQQALLDGAEEIVLDDDPLLSRLWNATGTPPAATELVAQLLADSPEDLRDGEFRLVVHGGTTGPAVACFGRFAHLLDESTRRALRELAAGTVRHPTQSPGAVPAQITFAAGHERGGNVAVAPRWAEHRIPLGVFPDEPGTLRLDELAVCADAHRLFVVDTASGREVAPVVMHKLDLTSLAPNAARLLADIAAAGVRGPRGFDWGRAAALPHTPRVRHGRSVLSAARWRPSPELRDQSAGFDEWLRHLRQWRRRWRVPDEVRVSYADQALDLRLDEPVHQRLLRHELGRREGAVLQEVPDPAQSGWLTGPGGGHRSELVIPLLNRRPHDEARPLPRIAPRRRGHPEHLPGGEWLYAVLPCDARWQDELLTSALPALLGRIAVDRWFFLRYAEHGRHHVRLRLRTEALDGVHRWMRELRADGVIGPPELRTYDPEIERYGGPEAITAAEEAFHADSRAVVETLALRPRLDLDPIVLAAAGCADLLRRFHQDGPLWTDLVLRAVPKDEHHREFQRRRREAVALIDPVGDWQDLRARPGGAALLEIWQRRATAIDDYARRLRNLGARSWSAPDEVVLSLLHMHHNRLAGVDGTSERAVLAVVRGVVQAHRDRQRSTR